MKKKRNGLVWKFTKKQNARGKYRKEYVDQPIYPVKRYDGQGNLIHEKTEKIVNR
jgi:hypothetical protein